MTVELLSVGTEILLGNIINTNSAYLSTKCAELGLSLYYQVSIGDNEERLTESIHTALSRSDIVLLTGGLGPTKDDITKETTANALGMSIVEDSHTKQRIQDYFKISNYKTISDNNWKQALVIDGAMVIDNHNGTAPGFIVETTDNKKVILLPGPPNEMIPMFERDIFPYLKELQPYVLYSKMVKICGIGESLAETMISDLIESQTNPTIAPYAKLGEVHFRVTANAKSIEDAKEMVKPIVTELKKRFKENIYTTKEEQSLEEVVVKLLKKNKFTLSVAESCTGGLLAGRIINVSGVSDVMNEGFITYSNKAKRKYLDVKKRTLHQFGAVSRETAVEMAKGVIIKTGADAALTITGIAGPEGGSEEKPVGLVYIACRVNGTTVVKENFFRGTRQKVREQSVVNALDLLRRCLLVHSN